MPNNAQLVSVSPESLARKHEARDPHLRNALISAASVVFMILLGLSVGAVFIHEMAQDRPMQNMRPLGLISAPNLWPLDRFPKPDLQIDDDHLQRIELIAEQKEKLETYGWVNHSNQIVRIPIERAMDLIVQRGLPARTNGISQTDGSPLQMIQEKAQQQ